MEAPQLRPLGVGDIVDRVFALYRSRPLLFLALAAVPYLLLFAVIAILGVTFAGGFFVLANGLAQGRSPEDLSGALVTAGLLALVVVVLAVVILSAQTSSLVVAMSQRYLGRSVTFGDALREGLRAAPRVIGAGLVVFVLVLVFWAVLGLVMVLANQVIVFIVGAFVGLVGTVYIFASVLVAPVIATLERTGPATALRRSWRLSEGNRWRIIGLQFLLFIVNVVISTVLSAIFVAPIISDTNVRTVIQQIVSLIANIAWAPVEWGTFAVLYFDLRVRHEAFDLTLAAEALPRDS